MFSPSVLRMIIGTTAGALLGLAYQHFIGCRTGSCPITANPYLSMILGALMGFLITYR